MSEFSPEPEENQSGGNRAEFNQDRPFGYGHAEALARNPERPQQQSKPREEKFDVYVHLANGDVLKLTKKALRKAEEESGTPHAFRKDGKEYAIIGVYPREVEHPTNESDEDE